MTLCSLVAAEGCSDAGVAAGVIKKEAPNVGKIRATAAPAEGADLPFAIDLPLARATAGGADGSALSLCGEEVRPNEGPFAWPHPTDPRDALFMVNDVNERAVWASAS